jgi:hypothetical protein
MASTFNSLHDNDVFGNMADDDDDELGFNLDGSGFGADDDDESMKTSSAPAAATSPADNGDNDLFDDDLPSDSEDADPYADPNDFFNAAADEEEESESATESKPEPAPKRRPGRPRKKQEPVAPQKQADPAPQPAQPDYSAYQQPQSDYPQQQDYNQQYAQPASSVQDYAQAYAAYQQPAQPDASNPFADASNQPAQPDYAAYQQPAQLEQPAAPVQQTTPVPVSQPSANTDSNAGMQSSASTWQSSTPMAPGSVPKPEMIYRIISVTDMIRDNLSGDEKEAVKLVLNMGAIKYDELSEMVYAVLNARKSVMTALQELLQARGMEAATRVFYLIRLDDSDLGIIADIGAKFGSDVIADKTKKEHYAITELADKAVSSMPDSSVNLLSAVLNVYNASKEIMNGR